MATLGELVIELGIVGDTKKLEVLNAKVKEAGKSAQETAEKFQKADNGVKTFIKGVGAIAGALTAAAIAINKLTDDLVRNNQAMLDLTRTTDIAQSTFQKWGGIGKMLGIENADQQLASLNERLFELRLTGEGARGFQLAGINPMGQDANGVLEQLRSRVKGMNDTTATYLLKQMGLDPRMLHLLRMEREEFEELGRTIKRYQLTPQQTKQIQEMNIQLQIAGIKLRYLRDRAVLALMPYWVKFMQSLARVAEMLVKVGREVGKFDVKWRGLIGVFVLGLSRIKAVQTFFASINGSVAALITKIPILGRAFAALGGIFARALLPLTALYLLLDDLAVYMQGGDSVVGMLLNYTETFVEDIKNLFTGFQEGNPLAPLVKGLTELSNLKIKPPPIITSIIAAGTAIGVIVQQMSDLKKKWDKNGTLTGGAAPVIGYNGELPDLSSVALTPEMQRNVSNSTSNSTTNQDNRISMNNYIQTSQPVADIERQILNAQFRQNALPA